jgi:xanthine dehydrogenase YagS FAD-binding subunit
MEWIAAKTVAEALAYAGPGARYVGGGLSLSLLAERGVERPQRLIDLSALPLRSIEGRQGELRIGAMVRLAALCHEPMVQTIAPLLRQVVAQIATPAIRNQATVGGELLERPRCPLFRDATNPRCAKRLPGSGCAVLEEAHDAGAIFGTSAACVAASASELAVALGALSAQVTLLSPEGLVERSLPVLDLYVEPGQTPEREQALTPGELLTSVTVPVSSQRRFGYARIADSPLVPLASAAVMMELRDQQVVDARVILGGLATRPWRARACEQTLLGHRVSDALVEQAVARVLDGAKPRPDSRHLPALATQVVRAALRHAVEEHATVRR